MQADVDVATPILSTFILGAQINAGHSKKKKKKKKHKKKKPNKRN